jgi:hypothetical protein
MQLSLEAAVESLRQQTRAYVHLALNLHMSLVAVQLTLEAVVDSLRQQCKGYTEQTHYVTAAGLPAGIAPRKNRGGCAMRPDDAALATLVGTHCAPVRRKCCVGRALQRNSHSVTAVLWHGDRGTRGNGLRASALPARSAAPVLPVHDNVPVRLRSWVSVQVAILQCSPASRGRRRERANSCTRSAQVSVYACTAVATRCKCAGTARCLRVPQSADRGGRRVQVGVYASEDAAAAAYDEAALRASRLHAHTNFPVTSYLPLLGAHLDGIALCVSGAP